MSAPPPQAQFPLGPALDFLRRLWRLNHALERASARMEVELGVTAQQRFLLRTVGRFPGITPGQVARVLHVDPGTVSATVRRLEQKGLVQRRRDPADHRRVALGLTRKGHGLDTPTRGTIESAAEELLATRAPGDVATALAVLDALVDHLDRQVTV